MLNNIQSTAANLIATINAATGQLDAIGQADLQAALERLNAAAAAAKARLQSGANATRFVLTAIQSDALGIVSSLAADLNAPATTSLNADSTPEIPVEVPTTPTPTPEETVQESAQTPESGQVPISPVESNGHVETNGHTPKQGFDPELGEWVPEPWNQSADGETVTTSANASSDGEGQNGDTADAKSRDTRKPGSRKPRKR